jgi:hypothetical protein
MGKEREEESGENKYYGTKKRVMTERKKATESARHSV